MLNKAKSLMGHALDSLDGEIGKVKDFYFDDKHWAIRYLIADTGGWLTGRKVLISPYALLASATAEQHIAVALTRQQIKDSPCIESDKPVSQQFEESYYAYYGWPMYGGAYMWGAYAYPYMPGMYPRVANRRDEPEIASRDEKSWDFHLRSVHEVCGYHVEALDGEIGHIEDVVIDDESWAIRYLIVATRNWWPGKRVLVSPKWIERVSWSDSKVVVNLSRDAIKGSPEFTDESLQSRDYETTLHRHYDRPGYWADEPFVQKHFV